MFEVRPVVELNGAFFIDQDEVAKFGTLDEATEEANRLFATGDYVEVTIWSLVFTVN